MTHVLLLTGSARPHSASTNVAKLVEAVLAKRADVTNEIVEVADLNLPFYDAATPPSAEGYEPPHESVKAWGDKVAAADAVIWIMPEYNHAMSGIQKNAVDWLFKEWNDKPLMMVGYGWHEGRNTLANGEIVTTIIKADLRSQVGLKFTEQINIDGTALDEATVEQRITTALDELLR